LASTILQDSENRGKPCNENIQVSIVNDVKKSLEKSLKIMNNKQKHKSNIENNEIKVGVMEINTAVLKPSNENSSMRKEKIMSLCKDRAQEAEK